jgi:hypothetical protein
MKKLIILIIICHSFLISQNLFCQWVQMSNGMGGINVYCFAVKDSFLFAGANGYGVYMSSNNGLLWIKTSLGNKSVNVLNVRDNNIYAGTSNNGVYRSCNNGLTWNQTNLNSSTIYSLASNDLYILAGYDNGIYKSTDKGESWNYLIFASTRSLFVRENYVYAGSMEGIYVSTTSGQNFFYGTLTSNYILSVIYHNNYLYAGSAYYGVYKSTNNGLNWYHTSLDSVSNYSFASYCNNIFAGGTYGVYLSSNDGANWFRKNEGMTGNYWVTSLIIFNGYIFAGTPNHGLWRRSLTDFVAVNKIGVEIPSSYTLNQNYPNPFNPSTFIKYQITKNSSVSLKVFDALGREVEILINEKQSPGTYEVHFNGSNLPSGIYFYKLETDNFSDVKKMVLIK